MNDINNTVEEQRQQPQDDTVTLTNVPHDHRPPLIKYAPDPLQWVELPFHVADDVDNSKSVAGWTSQYFGIYQDADSHRWIPIHLPTGQSLSSRIHYPTMDEAKACCAALMSLGIDWSREDPEALKHDPAATVAVGELAKNGLASFLTDVAFQLRNKRYSTMLKTANALNRVAVFDALRNAGVVSVKVDFDGDGDEGQIDNMRASGGEAPVELPMTPVVIHTPEFHLDYLTPEERDLASAIEDLCYGYLEEHHGGWEMAEGAYGEYQFDVPAGTIALEFNGRITDIETHNHIL